MFLWSPESSLLSRRCAMSKRAMFLGSGLLMAALAVAAGLWAINWWTRSGELPGIEAPTQVLQEIRGADFPNYVCQSTGNQCAYIFPTCPTMVTGGYTVCQSAGQPCATAYVYGAYTFSCNPGGSVTCVEFLASPCTTTTEQCVNSLGNGNGQCTCMSGYPGQTVGSFIDCYTY